MNEIGFWAYINAGLLVRDIETLDEIRNWKTIKNEYFEV